MADSQQGVDRLNTAVSERRSTFFTSSFPWLGKRWLELPILDAFNSPLKIDNLWTKDLTLVNGSFGEVRRFDRCTTCHKGIDKTQPGTADQPAYVPEHEVELVLVAPESPPDGEEQVSVAWPSVYGLHLAAEGLVESGDVAVQYIEPLSLAAEAVVVTPGESSSGFYPGDVLRFGRR